MLNSTKALLNVHQMGEADRLTIAGGTPGIVLMEDAGASVARVVGALVRAPGHGAVRAGQ